MEEESKSRDFVWVLIFRMWIFIIRKEGGGKEGKEWGMVFLLFLWEKILEFWVVRGVIIKGRYEFIYRFKMVCILDMDSFYFR